MSAPLALATSMSSGWLEPLWTYSFMRRALVGCMALSLGAAPVGVFLTLRRMSLTGDAMAHAILPGAALGYLVAGLSLTAMTFGGLLAGLLVALLSGAVSRYTRVREDANLAAFYLISLASGVLLVSVHGSRVDLMHVLFGTILALDNHALLLLASITTLTLMALALLYRPLVAECLDPLFLRAISRWSVVSHFTFLILAVMNLVAGFHALGTLMAVGIMILPATAARFWTQTLAGLLGVAVSLSLLGSLLGLLVSYHANLPSGPAIILTLGAVYLISVMFGRYGIVTEHLLARRHLQA